MSDQMSTVGGVDEDSPGRHPRRILIVSANMGAGHHATARAIEQTARRMWPDVQTRWVDTLDVMGPGVGPAFRQIYVTNVQTTPWLYEFFYESLWRHRWFATASKKFVGAWCGPRLAPVIRNYAPDLIVSTYPLGSAGLQWLREHRGLDVPVAAWVADFSPHPFWVYPDLDVHFVMHDECVRPAKTAEPNASIQVGATPASDAFQPGDQRTARAGLGLRQDAFVAVVSCGYYGFGTVEKAVDTLLDDPRVQIVALCGHNEQLRRRLAARGASPERLLALGWIEDMATYVVAGDVVVTNAGGATSLEAVACGRPVVMFEPIAAHGRANAELMAQAGLALMCRTPRQLRETISSIARDPERLAGLERAALRHTRSRTKKEDLRLAAGSPGGSVVSRSAPRLHRLQAEDAFFLYNETAAVNQVIGGVVHLERPVSLAEARAEIGRRLEALPNLRRRLVAPRSGWRRPGWLFEDSVDLTAHVTECVLGTEGTPATFAEVVDEFYSTPLDLGRQPWELMLVRDPSGGQSGLVVKLHHVLGDGFGALDSMIGLLDEIDEDAAQAGPSADAAASPGAHTGSSASPQSRSGSVTLVARRAERVVTGIWRLARAGGAPRSGLNGPMAPGRRRHALVSLPVPEVRATAHALESGTNALLLTVVTEGLNRLLDKRGERTTGASLRVMVPRTIRSAESRHALGNLTAAVPLDLPLGPVAARARLADIKDRMERSLHGGQPEASRFLIKAMGALPAPVHARVARAVYNGRWFNAILSMLPGPRKRQSFVGTRITEVYPVLPVAQGVGLSVGLMRWADSFAVGLTGDADLVGDVDELAEAVRAAFGEFRDAARE